MRKRFYLVAWQGISTQWRFDFAERGKLTHRLLWSYTSGVRKPSTAVALELKGRKKVDLIFGRAICAAHSRVVEVIEAHGFTGAGHFPVRLLGIKNSERYFGLMFKGKAGPPLGRRGLDPVKFDLKTWDGSDFFAMETTYCTLVTERVVKAFQEARITGADFDPVKV